MSGEILRGKGIIFWPVGTGDSTTIVIDDQHVLQVDLHDMTMASNGDATCTPLLERLSDALPRRAGRPYLAAFALTHADFDHCKGFGALLDSDILIGELWATPRLWREYAEDRDMCEDARRFHAEAKRRVAASLRHIAAGRPIPSGDRVRVIGFDIDESDNNHLYRKLPRAQLSFPGDTVTLIDGENVGHVFEAFIHAPFKDDCAAARNDTSLAMQITLKQGPDRGRLLLLGDLAYATIRRIFDRTAQAGNQDRVRWDVLLAPHHCSRKVMYVPDEAGGEELKRDILRDLDATHGNRAYVVASSNPIPAQNSPGDNPPHAKAKARYQELGIQAFICTQEHGSVEQPQPVVFGLGPGGGLVLQPADLLKSSAGTTLTRVVNAATAAGTLLATQEAVKRARGADSAPAKPVGFGRQ